MNLGISFRMKGLRKTGFNGTNALDFSLDTLSNSSKKLIFEKKKFLKSNSRFITISHMAATIAYNCIQLVTFQQL